MLMALFAHRFLTPPGSEPSMPPGHYDGSLALRVDDAGLSVTEMVRALPTRADRDRPDVLSTITKAERDRDGIAAQLGTKPAGERAKDAVARDSLWGPPEL
jgi:hypothetical protein